MSECPRCEGCGQLADTDDREPWTAWTSLPLQSSMAVLLGAVKPIPCDQCGGTGKVPESHQLPAARTQEALRLLEEALHLRTHGERAPGGTENWADWDKRAEVFLRSLSAPMREDGNHGH